MTIHSFIRSYERNLEKIFGKMKSTNQIKVILNLKEKYK